MAGETVAQLRLAVARARAAEEGLIRLVVDGREGVLVAPEDVRALVVAGEALLEIWEKLPKD